MVGETAVPAFEAWVLAMRGRRITEAMSKAAAQRRLVEMGLAGTDAMVVVASEFAVDALPQDAKGLRGWLGTAAEVLPRRVKAAQSTNSVESG